MGEENQALRRRATALEDELNEKTSSLQTATTLNTQLEEKLGSTRADYLEQRALADEATENFRKTELLLDKKTKEADLLRMESVSQESNVGQGILRRKRKGVV